MISEVFLYTSYVISNPERLSKTELVGFALFPDVNMVQDVLLHLPCDCQVICALCGVVHVLSHHVTMSTNRMVTQSQRCLERHAQGHLLFSIGSYVLGEILYSYVCLTLLLGLKMASPRSILASSFSTSAKEALRNAGCTITRLM